MNGNVNKLEKVTQERIISLFTVQLGYTFLGNLKSKKCGNIEEYLLRAYLTSQKYTKEQVNRAFDRLSALRHCGARKLYDVNREMYSLLRYGIPVKVNPGEPNTTVRLINWDKPEKNSFFIAEEVTVEGGHEKRPDIVLYVNGIAVAVLELKNSRKDLSEGVRQNLTNQRPDFIADFFTTVQFTFAGNDSQGLRYGTIGTPEKYYLAWKEDEEEDEDYKIDKYLKKLCRKDRIIELMRDFVLFDAGVKKLPRPHQYFAVKEAQTFAGRRKDGIIWHTQGSGKSITMVYLAKWILAAYPDARVLVVTDRDELDKQITGVFASVGEKARRAGSINSLRGYLQDPSLRLVCSLVHKFGIKNTEDFDAYIQDLENQPSLTAGNFFVFVDECHRTQYGRLHRAMKAFLPRAVFFGFTGTPLLKEDRATTREVFGEYIHTYKFNEAVRDGVVLDLVYEARDIDQRLGSPGKVDAWFEARTAGLNDFQKLELKKRWITMQKVLSSRPRMEKIVQDIVLDFAVKPRLKDRRGNAILVAASIFDACRYYELFQDTPLKAACAVVTSYNPDYINAVNEEIGEDTLTARQYIYDTYQDILKDVPKEPHKTKTEVYEDHSKKLFIEEPARMNLLIVVDKLLTGFDAPPCTCMYIDKSMQDHGLFQAICRVNRLDGDTKQFGYIIDYKDLFPKVENAVRVYTKPLDSEGFTEAEVDIIINDRLKKGKEKLDDALEAVELLCRPVGPKRRDLDYIHYFCGNTDIPGELQATEQLRHSLYKSVASLVRSYANIADNLEEAGYTTREIDHIKVRVSHYTDVREIIKNASGETIDLRAYEADMRHLLDTYVQAGESRVVADFENKGLLEIIHMKDLQAGIEQLPESLRKDKDAVAETIENNVRRKIYRDQMLDPAFYERVSRLLDEIIRKRKEKAVEYAEYLKEIEKLIDLLKPGGDSSIPSSLDNPLKIALYNNLGNDEPFAVAVYEKIKAVMHKDWKGHPAKEGKVRNAIYDTISDEETAETIFEIVKAQPEP